MSARSVIGGGSNRSEQSRAAPTTCQTGLQEGHRVLRAGIGNHSEDRGSAVGGGLGNLGGATMLGQFEKSIGFHEQALVVAQEIGDRRVWKGMPVGISAGSTRQPILPEPWKRCRAPSGFRAGDRSPGCETRAERVATIRPVSGRIEPNLSIPAAPNCESIAFEFSEGQGQGDTICLN